jgi:SAM-dependent methyltransferase
VITPKDILRPVYHRVLSAWKSHVLGVRGVDYRETLFEDLKSRLDGRKPERILEVGPKDGKDTRRLLTLEPSALTLFDLPGKEALIHTWLPSLEAPGLELIIGNIMYDQRAGELEPYDVVWCTGVLYHNPEQLRMVSRLFNLLKPDGLLVIESATARRMWYAAKGNFVEIWYPPSEEAERKHFISANITHLPSRRAIESWMRMVGLEDVGMSDCHSRSSRKLARVRAAFIGRRSKDAKPAPYSSDPDYQYPIGQAM